MLAALTWPRVFAPQQRNPPVVISAHVCASPAVTAATPVSTSVDGGVFRLVLVPSPSCRAQYKNSSEISKAHKHRSHDITY